MLFVHGTAGAGPVWAPLVHELRGVRCLLLERPGRGLSAPVDYPSYQYKSLVVDLLTGVLDALGVDRAHVVGGSIGTVWALRLAAARPSRVDRAVLIGAGPVAPGLCGLSPQLCVRQCRADARLPCRFLDLTSYPHRPLPAHLPTTNATPAPHQHSRTNPTPAHLTFP